jgi:YidC/Oxa1 family membrane protein insertase
VGGIAFPLGVLLYWTTSNLWTMGQQFYVIRNNPTPGTPAFEAKRARDATKVSEGDSGAVKAAGTDAAAVSQPPPPATRSQPRKQSRSQRRAR